MTLDEIKQRFPDEWVLIAYASLDDELRVTDGKVIAHSPDRDQIDKQLMTVKSECIAVEFTGEGDTDESYLL